MPVTIKVANHAPKKWKPMGQGRHRTPASTPSDLLERACPAEYLLCDRIQQSSFSTLSSPQLPPSPEEAAAAPPPATIYASSNGFVRSAIYAYNGHHHLTIRPEDIWFSILTQLGFYVNSHAAELRSFFVAHERKKPLTVYFSDHDFAHMAMLMTEEISKNVVDPDLKDWIMPDFSTTTEEDRVVAAVLMMGALKQYFEYFGCTFCGIPSVTILGERADWEKMLSRLDLLPRLGAEPAQFAALLRPVIGYFIQSFDDPFDPAVISFWGRIAHKEFEGSGSATLTGWMTAFCFWNIKGKCLYRPPRSGSGNWFRLRVGCDLDGTLYHCIDIDDVPDGSAGVPVTINDRGNVYNARMVAGSVGIRVTSSGDILDSMTIIGYVAEPDGGRIPQYTDLGPEIGPDSLQPVSGWWIYKTVENQEGGDKEKNKWQPSLVGGENLRPEKADKKVAAQPDAAGVKIAISEEICPTRRKRKFDVE